MTGIDPRIILLAMGKGEVCDVGTTGWIVRRNPVVSLWQFTNPGTGTDWINLGKAVQTYERILKS